MGHCDDTGLIKACLNNDRRAWDRLVSRYAPLVLWVVRQKFHTYKCTYLQEDSEEICQQVFEALLKKDTLRSLAGRKTLSPWFTVVAGNCAVSHIRKNTRETPCDPVRLNAVTHSTAFSGDNDAAALSEERMRILEQALMILTAKERLCLDLCYRGGKKQHEIAALLDLPLATVSIILARAKARLKKYFKKNVQKRAGTRIYK